MERNPNKPRLARKDSIAEAFFSETGASRVPIDPMSGMTGASLAGMTPGEQAGVLITDRDTREELLASLKGQKPAK